MSKVRLVVLKVGEKGKKKRIWSESEAKGTKIMLKISEFGY